MKSIPEIEDFLLCATPLQWIETAVVNQEILLIDHANCEKKAAATAMRLLYRYVDKSELLKKMSQLAREELRHFEQVVNIMQERDIPYALLSASRYASSLRALVRNPEPSYLVDILIVGAFVEARSCERFAALAPRLDDELATFYTSLLKSETRHYQDYLGLAQLYADEDISTRVALFAEKEQSLILDIDHEFRFLSGMPALDVQEFI